MDLSIAATAVVGLTVKEVMTRATAGAGSAAKAQLRSSRVRAGADWECRATIHTSASSTRTWCSPVQNICTASSLTAEQHS